MRLEALIAPMKLDPSDYNAGLRSAENTARASAQRIGNIMTKTGLALGAIGLPFAALIKDAIGAASDLRESQNAVNVVFGESSNVLLDYSQTAASSIGLSAQAFNQAGAVMGAMLQNLGFDQAAAARQTIILTERASDMASIFNTDVATALAAIQSGLKGEFNPLEQFGVKLNMAAVNAKAMELGLANANGELDDAAKAQAILAIVMEQTDKVAGDFVNTSDQLANSQRILTAELEDAKAALGEEFLPIALEVVTALKGMLSAFKGLSPEVQKGIAVIAGLMAALVVIGPVISGIGALIAIGITGPMLLMGAIVGAAIGGLVLMIQKVRREFENWKVQWKAGWAIIADVAQKAISFIKGLLNGLQLPAWVTDFLGGGKNNTKFTGYGGPRATGGPVRKNTAYWVGEREAELFVPEVNGRIFNQSQLGENKTVQVTVNSQNSIDYPRLAQEIVTALRPALQARPAR